MAKLSVYNKDGKETGSIDLPDDLFGKRVNKSVIHQAVLMYQASLRQGNASTKERADVKGGGKKPYRQKGTGRSRAGSIRSPIWQGGGVTFGPHPRDFSYTLPKRIRQAALRESLNAKFLDKNLLCIDDFSDKFSKTKEFAKILSNLKLRGKILALLDGADPSVQRVTRNIPLFHIGQSADVNAYDILKNKKILITKSAVANLLKRMQGKKK